VQLPGRLFSIAIFTSYHAGRVISRIPEVGFGT